MAKDVRLKIYPAIIGVLGICLIALLLSRLEIRVEPTPPSPDALSNAPEATNPSPVPSVSAVSPSPLVPLTPGKPQGSLGRLRISNQTEYPMRIALLPHRAKADKQGTDYDQPVHWDFAPGEGSAKGLILSLPDGDIKLQAGDVLVAFAQDGSRRYWGPYVLGKTPFPVWDAKTSEWQMVLQP